MSQLCQCAAENKDCDTLIDVFTPLIQVIGGRKYRILLENLARQVLLSDGSNVETRLKTIERALSAFSTTRFAEDIYMRDSFNSQVVEGDRCYVFDAADDENVEKGGAMYLWHDGDWQLLYDGDIPLDVNAIIKENGGLKIEDGRLVIDILKLLQAIKGDGLEIAASKLNVALTDDLDNDSSATALSAAAGKVLNEALALLAKQAMQSFAPNEEIWITESGDFTVSHAGWYEVFLIGGGNGSIGNNGTILAGASGSYNSEIIFLEKDAEIPVSIGAGGIGKGNATLSDYTGYVGGVTTFGDLSSNPGGVSKHLDARAKYFTANSNSYSEQINGSGFGGGYATEASNHNGRWYGAGAGVMYKPATNTYLVGNGMQGAVRLRGHNPEYDTLPNAIELPSYADLADRVAALEQAISAGE